MLSRAKLGLIIVGNIVTLKEGSNLWKIIISYLAE